MKARVICKFSWRGKGYEVNDPIVIDDDIVAARLVKEGFVSLDAETTVPQATHEESKPEPETTVEASDPVSTPVAKPKPHAKPKSKKKRGRIS